MVFLGWNTLKTVLTYAAAAVPLQMKPWYRRNSAALVATVAASPRPLGLRELARLSEVPLSTAHRLVAELASAGVLTVRGKDSSTLVELAPDYPRAGLPERATPLPVASSPPAVDRFVVIDAAALHKYGVSSRATPFVLAAEGATLPAGLSGRVVQFKERRPTALQPPWPEEIVLGLLVVDQSAALKLVRSGRVDFKRLRLWIHAEGLVNEAIASGVADVAWSHRHHLIHMGYKFPLRR